MTPEASAAEGLPEGDNNAVLDRRVCSKCGTRWSGIDAPLDCPECGGPSSEHPAEIDARRCCDLHNRNCEPPCELCCEECTEAAHPGHRDGSECIAPDLSGFSVLPPEASKP